MPRSRRLEPLAKVADKRQQDAARVMQQHREELARYQQQLDDMRRYREEYSRGFQERASDGVLGDQVKTFRIFLANLDEAIRQLETLIDIARRHHQDSREQWLETRSRHRALEQAVERFRSLEARDLVRREERDSDERTQRRR